MILRTSALRAVMSSDQIGAAQRWAFTRVFTQACSGVFSDFPSWAVGKHDN